MKLSQHMVDFSHFEVFGLCLFITVLMVQIYFYLKYFLPLQKHTSKPKKSDEAFVSIVIAARNEEKKIGNLIKAILKQHYSNYEIVIVNDYSTDRTLQVLKQFQDERITVIQNDGEQGKKSALTLGINSSKYELLLFTDADCWPNSDNWITKMTKNFTEDIDIVLGFGAFQKEKYWLNKLIRFEGFLSALQYFGFAKAGKAYMGVGRNLAYKKKVFRQVKGFETHKNILSGDDDLLVNKVATDSNVAIELSENSFTFSDGENTWKQFILQKRRQLTAGSYYKQTDKIRLAFFGASSFLYYSLFVTLCLFSSFTTLIILIFVGKQILEYLLFKPLAKHLKVEDLIPWLVVLEPFHIVTMTAIGVSTWFGKVKEWK